MNLTISDYSIFFPFIFDLMLNINSLIESVMQIMEVNDEINQIEYFSTKYHTLWREQKLKTK